MTKYFNFRRQKVKERSILKRRNRSKLKKKQRNINRNKQKKDNVVVKKKYDKQFENIIINAGNSLSLFDNPEHVIDLLEKLDKHKTKSKRIKNIQINLSAISSIDIGGITCLLAKINEMSKVTKMRIWGISPQNKECKDVFNSSGFLEYMTDLSGNRFTSQSENFIFKVGTDKTRNERVGKTIEKAIQYLTNKEEKYPPVYSIVQEICSNSVEWANAQTNNKNWFLGINKKTSSEGTIVNFTMTDMGYGILHTLRRKFKDIIAELLFTKDTEILKRAVERKYGSKTQEVNRNRGLPLIQNRFDNGYILDLCVITNNVIYYFGDQTSSRVLNKNFPGTFYFWNVDNNCIEKWKGKKII